MSKTITCPYDVAQHLRTPEEMAAYLEACIEEANSDSVFLAKVQGDIARAKSLHSLIGLPSETLDVDSYLESCRGPA